MSSEIVPSVRSIGERAREVFNEQQVALIRNTVAKDASPAELAMFLELCARYELDPFAGQIYCAKMGGRDGESGRMTIIVGRDGFLRIAERHADYEGFDSDVVREKDSFRFERGEDGRPIARHDYGGATHKQRGALVGAWAIVYRHGRRPRSFYAPIEEYRPTNEKKLKFSPWGAQESLMLDKCAITTALRLAFSISGLVGEEEASRQLTKAPAEELTLAEDPELAARLTRLFAEATALQADAWRPAKVRLLLRGKTDEERALVADDVEQWIAAHQAETVEVEEAEFTMVEPEGQDPTIDFPEPHVK